MFPSFLHSFLPVLHHRLHPSTNRPPSAEPTLLPSTAANWVAASVSSASPAGEGSTLAASAAGASGPTQAARSSPRTSPPAARAGSEEAPSRPDVASLVDLSQPEGSPPPTAVLSQPPGSPAAPAPQPQIQLRPAGDHDGAKSLADAPTVPTAAQPPSAAHAEYERSALRPLRANATLTPDTRRWPLTRFPPACAAQPVHACLHACLHRPCV